MHLGIFMFTNLWSMRSFVRIYWCFVLIFGFHLRISAYLFIVLPTALLRSFWIHCCRSLTVYVVVILSTSSAFHPNPPPHFKLLYVVNKESQISVAFVIKAQVYINPSVITASRVAAANLRERCVSRYLNLHKIIKKRRKAGRSYPFLISSRLAPGPSYFPSSRLNYKLPGEHLETP